MKNIVVMDGSGNIIGLTYPRRARGLIKTGRAVPAGASVIRLTGTGSSAYKEDASMPITICFKPENFTADKAFPGTVLNRRFPCAAPGGMPTEVLTLQGSGDQPGAIVCPPVPLSGGQPCILTLWMLPDKGAQITWRVRYTGGSGTDTSCVAIPFTPSGEGWTFCTVPFGEDPEHTAAILSLEVSGGSVSLLSGQDPEDRPDSTVMQERAAGTDTQEEPETAQMPAEVPAPHVSPLEDARAQMLRALTSRLEALDMSQPWCVDAMKEMKDMIERILRQY